MALTVTRTALSPQQRALGVMAQSSHGLLVEVKKTTEEFRVLMEEKEKALQEQSARIVRLEGRVLQLVATNQNHQVVEQALQGRVNQLLSEKSELLEKIAYQQRGIDKLNAEVAEHLERRSQYYDIIGAFLGWPGHSLDAALDKCRRFGFSILRRIR